MGQFEHNDAADVAGPVSHPAETAGPASTGDRVARRVVAGDQRDAAAAGRDRERRERAEAAAARDIAAEAREAAGDYSGAAADRLVARQDREAAERDADWDARDRDAAAGDRALLVEVLRMLAPGPQPADASSDPRPAVKATSQSSSRVGSLWGHPTADAVLADALTGDPAVSLTQRLCDLLPAALSVDAAACCAIESDSIRQVLAATGPAAATAEETQLSLGEGPCLSAATSGHPVLVPDLDEAPNDLFVYAQQVRGVTPFRAVYAFPARIGGVHVGALDCYRRDPGPFPGDLGAAAAIAECLAWAAMHDLERPTGQRDPSWVDESQQTLNALHRAAGAVSVQLDVPIDVAIARLRAHAYLHSMPLDAVTSAVLDHRLTLDPAGPSA